MSFNYDKLKSKEESQSYWASYSDLFMMLSIVFLLLYVIAGLRTGASSLQQKLEYQRVSELNEDYKQQIKVYNALKDEHLEKGASEEEAEVYKSLMDKLHLLKEEAKKEKEDLRMQAKENEEKEFALNKYQQLVRGIINTNMLSKVKIQKKQKQLKKLKQKSAQQLAELKTKTAKELKKLRVKEAQTSANLERTRSDLSVTQRALAKEGRQKEELVEQLSVLKEQHKQERAKIESEYEKRRQRQKAQYQEMLKKQKMSSKQKAKAWAKYKKQVQKEKQAFKSKMAGLNNKISESESELKKAQYNLNARKRLAGKIKENFRKAGISADVDEKTGDVVLSFGDEYFDSGKANLKSEMRNILKKSMPVYAKSLFEDKEVAKKLSFVEVVGFASPTYKGKFVDPQSIKSEHQQAVKYNLDLSYKRASSIFDYVFDTKKMSFEQQKKLRKLVKVSGQGFLSENINERELASEMSTKEFCAKHDCKKAQRVIIKFDLED